MSIFNNISFLSEGEQADAYKARKAKEEEDRRKAEEERTDRRYNNFASTAGQNPRVDNSKLKNNISKFGQRNYGDEDQMLDRVKKYGITDAEISRAKRLSNIDEDDWTDDDHKFIDDFEKSGRLDKIERGLARDVGNELDAAARHMRRHPDKWEDGKLKRESSIFESVQFI